MFFLTLGERGDAELFNQACPFLTKMTGNIKHIIAEQVCYL